MNINSNTEFINREESLQLVLSLLSEGKTQTNSILEFYGISGIGKTYFLQEIKRIIDKQSVHCALVDLSKVQASKPSEATSILTKTIIEEWRVSSVSLEVEKIYNFEDFEETLSGSKRVLIFDGTDEVNSQLLEWIEHKVLLPLHKLRSVILIISGKSSVRWQTYLIRRAVVSHVLQPFSLQATRNLLKQWGYERFADRIHYLAGGVPLAIKLLARVVNEIEQESHGDLELSKFGDYEIRLIQAIEDEYIGGSIIEQLDSDLYRNVRILSVFRQFNEITISELEPFLNKDPLDRFSHNEITSIIQEIISHDLGSWDPARTAYSLQESVRRLFGIQLRITDTKTYVAVSEKAVRFYIDRFETTQDERLIPEILFHSADTMRIHKQMTDIEIAQELLSVQKHYLNGFLARSEDTVFLAKKLQEIIVRDFELAERIGDRRSPNFLAKAIEDFIKQVSNLKIRLVIRETFKSQYNVRYEIIGDAGSPITLSENVRVEERRRREIASRAQSMSTLKDLISLGQLIKTEFFPVRFQTILKGLSHPVILDVEDPNIPWELIHDGQQFTFLKVALGKRLITAEEHKENIPSKNKRLRILIVGVSETKVEGFTSLPTVEHEVELLQELFAQMPQVEDLTEDDVLFGKNAKESAFIERLVSGVYDVIHFSGHAYFNEESPELSALILNDHAFTVNDIKRKVEGKPLVFLNACVSGVYQRVESDIGYIGSFTVGLASAFIIGGALASIGTLMNVTDSYASEFALAFYKNALSGEALGDSLKRSRQKLKDLYPDNLVWASYMLFGDPTIRLKSQE